jgi:hypothetical protein
MSNLHANAIQNLIWPFPWIVLLGLKMTKISVNHSCKVLNYLIQFNHLKSVYPSLTFALAPPLALGKWSRYSMYSLLQVITQSHLGNRGVVHLVLTWACWFRNTRLSLEASQIDHLLARAGYFKQFCFLIIFLKFFLFSGHRLRLLLTSNPFHFGRSKCKFDCTNTNRL